MVYFQTKTIFGILIKIKSGNPVANYKSVARWYIFKPKPFLVYCIKIKSGNPVAVELTNAVPFFQIFNNILRRQIGTRTPTVEYICTKPDILFTLCRG
jgi:hypothetical protein